MITRIKNGKLIIGDDIICDKFLYFEDGCITHITEDALPFDQEIDAQENYVSPGFIDIHVHGGSAREFVDATEDAVLTVANTHAVHGTTTIYPTLSAYNYDITVNTLEAIQNCIGRDELLPNIAGVHLEGPYFSPNQVGAQDPRFIRNPDKNEYEKIVEKYGHLIKRWSYAPEREGAIEFQDFLMKHNIIGSAAHTDAEYDHVKEAYDHGLRNITHLYSCTSTITRHGGFRHLGVIESAWILDDMYVETIADGCHLPPQLLAMIYKLKGPHHMCLVTDATRFGGVTDFSNIDTSVGPKKVAYIIEDGVAKLADRSAFAGSIATTDTLVRVCYKRAGIPLTDAVKMITEIPATIMCLDKKGALKVGHDADIVIFDDDVNLDCVIVNGRRIV